MDDLVTLADCYAQTRIDPGGPDDSWLAIAIPAVSGAIALWLKDAWRLYVPAVDADGVPVLDELGNPVAATDSGGLKIVHPTVKLAALVEIANQALEREGGGENAVPSSDGHGYTLGRGATSLLTPLRKPTVA